MTEFEKEKFDHVKMRLDEVRELLSNACIEADSTSTDWHACLSAMKIIVGNSHNDMEAVALLVAKSYLLNKFSMVTYDVLKKPRGTAGHAIDERTIDGTRVIAELKTTSAFGHKDILNPHKNYFLYAFRRLSRTPAEHKFFFVTDREIFEILKAKYAHHLTSITVVLLPENEEHTID